MFHVKQYKRIFKNQQSQDILGSVVWVLYIYTRALRGERLRMMRP